MVAQLLEVLRQGIWASLTGGYFYQPQNNSFCNSVQLYTWIVLVAFPFSLYLYGSSLEAWTGYIVSVTVLFASVKFANWQLHNLFDRKEIIEEVPGAKDSADDGDELELKTFATASETQLAAAENEDSCPSEPTVDTSNLQNFVQATIHQKSSVDDFPDVSKEEVKEDTQDVSSVAVLELEELQNKDESPSVHEKSPSIKEEHERPSMKSGISSVSSFLPSTERRFSNVSNLARSIVSSTGGSTGFQGLHAAGSLELGYVLEESPVRRPKNRKQTVRRTQSAVVTSPGIGSYEPPPSHIVSLDPIGRSDFLRPLDTRRQPSASIKPISENAEGATTNGEKGKDDEEEEEKEESSESDRKSFERTRKSPSTSSKSLDKPLQVTFASEFTVVPINIDSEVASVCDNRTSPSGDKVKDCDSQPSSDNASECDNHENEKKGDISSENAVAEKPSVEQDVSTEREPKRWSVSSFVGLSRLFKVESSEDLSFSYQAIPAATENSSYASPSLSDESEYETDPKSPLLTNPQIEPPQLPTDGLGSDACRSELGRLLIDILSRDNIEGCEKELEKLRMTLSKTQANEARNHSEESDSFPSAGPSSSLDPNWMLCPWSPTRAGLRPAPPPPTLESCAHVSRTPTPPPVHPRSHRIRNRPLEDYLNLLGRRESDESPSELPTRSHLPWNVYSIESRVGNEPLTQIGPLPLPPLGRPWISHNHGDSSSVSQTFATVRADRTFPSPGGSSVSLGNSGTLVIDSPNVRFVRNRLRTYTARGVRREHLQPSGDGILPISSPDYFNPLTLHAMLNTLPTAISPQDERERIEEPVIPKPKRYYKFSVCKKSMKIRYDRLQLLALLDRNWSVVETVLSVLLALLVAILGAVLLSRNLCQDFTAFLLCVVIGGCQYSLFKSVQPDAASPTHGFNRLVAFSRPTFFCIFSAIVILIDMCLEVRHVTSPFLVYGFDITSIKLWMNIRDLVMLIILCFPLIFTLGMLPQISTFLMYVLEQIDINIFGGSAVTGLLSAFYAILRSIFLVTILYGFAYLGLIQPEKTQHVLFSIFCALLASSCYHFSRYSSDPSVLISMASKKSDESGDTDFRDPLPAKLKDTVLKRLKSDIIMCLLIGILVFAVHVSTVFTVLQKILTDVLWSVAVAVGFVLHYVIPQARKKLPWSCFAHPFLKPSEYERFEVSDMAKLMWFEKLYVWVGFFEKNILYIVLYLCAFTRDSNTIVVKYGIYLGTLIVVICAIKCIRSTLNNPSHNYIVILFTIAFFNYDLSGRSETFLVDYCVMLTVYQKVREMLLKVQFVTTYVAPWQISWGSAFHAFAQPISIPHSAMLFVQAAFSSVFSAPLSPFLGSAIFLTSYARPIKFWEKDYNTKRIDSSNTKLVSQLERNLGSDDNNLNSIFYEQLTRSLQHTLAGDLILGRWGTVSQGDCFILTSDNMNCLVHIIEIANGLVTFQLRGMEFRGTYCQQREIEAITEDVEDDQGCCCCEPGHLPHMLSGNAAFSQRWLAWQVTATKYVVEGYTVSDNNAASVLQVYDLRKLLITFYVKAVIYFAMTSPKLTEWLETPAITEGIAPLSSKVYVDVDPTFNKLFDEDFDYQSRGISRNSFSRVYLEWIKYCAQRREKKMEIRRDSVVVSFCMALSLLARRCLCSASPKALSSVDFFLHCLHSLFKGDFRVTCPRDEWVFTDMDLLKKVIAPAVKMSVKLHQDHFMSPDEYDDPQCLYEAIESHQKNWFISHEGDPAWRTAVLSGVPSLLALRHVVDAVNETSLEYKIVMLNKRWLSFRVIKLNRECVRGFWAGQQQELVFLRNRHAERGSIQNAKQVLRNIINSSCDQPIGYPIFVSPLTTSYADTHPQLNAILGGPIEFGAIRRVVRSFWNRLRRRCREGCVSGGSAGRCEENISLSTLQFVSVQQGRLTGEYYSSVPILGAPATVQRGSRGSLGTQRGSVGSTLSTTRKPSGSTLVSLAGLLSERDAGSLESSKHDPGTSRDYFSTFYRAPTEPDIEEAGPLRHDQIDRPKNLHVRGKQLSQGDDTDESKAGETSKSSLRTARNPFVLKAVIRNADSVYDSMNLGRRIDPIWPCQEWKDKGGRNAWKYWVPDQGMEGEVVHMWVPYHHIPEYRSPVFRKILLLRIDQWYVPIAESGVEYLGNFRAVIDPDLQIFRPIRKNLPLGCTISFEFVMSQAPVKPPRSSTSKLEYPVAGTSSDVRNEEDTV